MAGTLRRIVEIGVFPSRPLRFLFPLPPPNHARAYAAAIYEVDFTRGLIVDIGRIFSTPPQLRRDAVFKFCMYQKM